MNREIKFRGKRLDNGEWVYGYYAIIHHSITDIEHDTNTIVRVGVKEIPCIFNDEINDNSSYWKEVDADTVGQFTGLLDKNGKEIYEGDIIGCPNPETKHLIIYHENEGRFKAALDGYIEINFLGIFGVYNAILNASKEVIGNIHDNPELLKGGEK